VKHLLAGNAEIAFANIEPLFFAAEQGEKLKAVYTVTVQVGQMIMPLPADMPSRLLEARRALPHPAAPPRPPW
jgi:hypothetical protein